MVQRPLRFLGCAALFLLLLASCLCAAQTFSLNSPFNVQARVTTYINDPSATTVTSDGRTIQTHVGRMALDLVGRNPDGTAAQVYAAASGTVLVAKENDGLNGNYVVVDHGNGYFTAYCHLASIDANVRVGQPVPAGGLGQMGHSGTERDHLHFQVYFGNNEVAARLAQQGKDWAVIKAAAGITTDPTDSHLAGLTISGTTMTALRTTGNNTISSILTTRRETVENVIADQVADQIVASTPAVVGSSAQGVQLAARLPAGSVQQNSTYLGTVGNNVTAIRSDAQLQNVVNTILAGLVSPSIGLTLPIYIVLEWGSIPHDLDVHLTGPISANLADARFHVSYSNMGNLTSAPHARVLNDAPYNNPRHLEITAINQVLPGMYRFYVHDFSNTGSTTSTALANSGAIVTVYQGGAAIPNNVATTAWPGQLPSLSGLGRELTRYQLNTSSTQVANTWQVFELDGRTGAIRQVNELRSGLSGSGVTFNN